jgi:hypothetical protein
MIDSIALSGATFQAFSDTIKMPYYGSKSIADGNKKIIRIGKLRIKMFYFLVCYIICISFCTSARQTTPVCRLRLSTALYGKLHVLSVKTICTDDCWWPQVSNAAGIRNSCQHRSKERLHRSSFYLIATPTNFTKIEHPLKVSYQTHQRHSPYSLCYRLDHKAL